MTLWFRKTENCSYQKLDPVCIAWEKGIHNKWQCLCLSQTFSFVKDEFKKWPSSLFDNQISYKCRNIVSEIEKLFWLTRHMKWYDSNPYKEMDKKV